MGRVNSAVASSRRKVARSSFAKATNARATAAVRPISSARALRERFAAANSAFSSSTKGGR
jgi:hypothetical protein